MGELMNWGIEDLVASIALVGGAGIILAVVITTVPSLRMRQVLAGAVILALLAIWAHLSVGVF